MIEALPQVLGLPTEAFRTILYHATADQEHQVEIRNLINKHVTSDYLFGIVQHSAAKSLIGWTRLFTKYVAEAVRAFAAVGSQTTP
jgi:hypothetical protein